MCRKHGAHKAKEESHINLRWACLLASFISIFLPEIPVERNFVLTLTASMRIHLCAYGNHVYCVWNAENVFEVQKLDKRYFPKLLWHVSPKAIISVHVNLIYSIWFESGGCGHMLHSLLFESMKFFHSFHVWS